MKPKYSLILSAPLFLAATSFVRAERQVWTLTETFFQWEKDAMAYDKARARLAAMIIDAAAAPERK